MREKLNSNPLAQVAVVGVLLVAAAIFFLASMGAAEKNREAGSSSIANRFTGVKVRRRRRAKKRRRTPRPARRCPALATPPLPRPVLDAWNGEPAPSSCCSSTTAASTTPGQARPAAASTACPASRTFVVPAERDRPLRGDHPGRRRRPGPGAGRGLRPKQLDQAVPTASVSYGFQSAQSVVQAVIDAGYKGPTLDYHP